MANLIYFNDGTVKQFMTSGGDVTFTLTSLANGAGRVSAQLDLGAAPRSRSYRWLAEIQCQATPTAGSPLRIYLAESQANDGTLQSGNVGTADAAISAETSFMNCRPVDSIKVRTAAADTKFTVCGVIEIAFRYVSVGFWNATGAALTTTASHHRFVLQPIPYEVQA